ncbi:MAG: PspC domain-containing protein [Candidatus Pacebacteria bacterium]|nr:PspC domain-containing protein [Candidatus Paceibacterota bacterium]
MKKKQLYRSAENKIFAGIFGGLGEHFDIDPTLLRLVWVVVTVFSGIVPGLLIYVIALFIVPQRPSIVFEEESHDTAEV